MTFSNLYGSVLFPFVKQYQDAKNEKGRKTVIANAANAVKESKALLEEADELPKELNTVCIPICSFLFLTYT
jgi:hypothetical protein